MADYQEKSEFTLLSKRKSVSVAEIPHQNPDIARPTFSNPTSRPAEQPSNDKSLVKMSFGAKTLNYLLSFRGPVKISLQQGQDTLSILKRYTLNWGF
jgi:hypothetical protein